MGELPVRISHYVVIDRLGAGGMGEVFRAIDERLRREVAVKRLLPSASDGARQLRMLREAQAACNLDHRGFATIYDVGVDAGRPFIVMELVVGDGLRTLAGKLAPRQAAQLIAEAAEALAVAHKRGVLHRDIKSDNLMRATDGRVKVLDFGLAKLFGDHPAHGAGARGEKRSGASNGDHTASVSFHPAWLDDPEPGLTFRAASSARTTPERGW